MSDDDYGLEYSPLSGRVTRDGVTVDVQIYRAAETNDPWHLEVVDHEGGSSVWNDCFATPQDAYAAFNEAVAEEGIGTFAEATANTRH
jgi:hypothetical protein